jgi:hypothetical protein
VSRSERASALERATAALNELADEGAFSLAYERHLPVIIRGSDHKSACDNAKR